MSQYFNLLMNPNQIKGSAKMELVTVFTHIEEECGKNYDEYKAIEKQYRKYSIYFAYDGMKISV
jgi:hypothetical protein